MLLRPGRGEVFRVFTLFSTKVEAIRNLQQLSLGPKLGYLTGGRRWVDKK